MVRLSELIAVFYSIALVSQSVQAEDAAKKTFEVETHADMAYRSDKEADPVKHKLDIYLPKGQKDFPVMMFVHGGSWKSGNKGLYAALGSTFAKQGIGTVIINYRLSDIKYKAKHPEHIQDVASAFAWVHANIGKYGGRDDRIFVSGHSAGAHLVALLATDETYLKAHKLGLDNIRGVMSLSGVYEIVPNFFVYDGPFGKDEAIRKAASPLFQVKEKHPPFLICYGDRDFPTIDKMSETFCKKLVECKGDACILKMEKRDHFSIIIQLAINAEDPCTKAMTDFIAKRSK